MSESSCECDAPDKWFNSFFRVRELVTEGGGSLFGSRHSELSSEEMLHLLKDRFRGHTEGILCGIQSFRRFRDSFDSTHNSSWMGYARRTSGYSPGRRTEAFSPSYDAFHVRSCPKYFRSKLTRTLNTAGSRRCFLPPGHLIQTIVEIRTIASSTETPEGGVLQRSPNFDVRIILVPLAVVAFRWGWICGYRTLDWELLKVDGLNTWWPGGTQGVIRRSTFHIHRRSKAYTNVKQLINTTKYRD